MDPVLLIGRYPYSHWVLGARPGGIEFYRPLPQLGILPYDRGNLGGSPLVVTLRNRRARALHLDSLSGAQGQRLYTQGRGMSPALGT